MKRLGRSNYIVPSAEAAYKAAFIREYKKFIGEPVPMDPTGTLQIRVLGPGCPSCDKLEKDLMEVMAELNLPADLDHVRDRQGDRLLRRDGQPRPRDQRAKWSPSDACRRRLSSRNGCGQPRKNRTGIRTGTDPAISFSFVGAAFQPRFSLGESIAAGKPLPQKKCA